MIRITGQQPYLAHLEFQPGPDVELDRRMLLYNVLLRWRHRLPVRSVAVLLRPEAQPAGVTGGFRDLAAEDDRLEFS